MQKQSIATKIEDGLLSVQFDGGHWIPLMTSVKEVLKVEDRGGKPRAGKRAATLRHYLPLSCNARVSGKIHAQAFGHALASALRQQELAAAFLTAGATNFAFGVPRCGCDCFGRRQGTAPTFNGISGIRWQSPSPLGSCWCGCKNRFTHWTTSSSVQVNWLLGFRLG